MEKTDSRLVDAVDFLWLVIMILLQLLLWEDCHTCHLSLCRLHPLQQSRRTMCLKIATQSSLYMTMQFLKTKW